MDILFLMLLGVITLFAVINCAIRGKKRSLVRLVFILIAAGIALFLTPVVSEKLLQVDPLFEFREDSALVTLAAASPTFGAALRGFPKAVWSVLAYPVVFFVLCILMTIPVSIVNRKTERTKKGAGALVGILVGVIGFSLAFAPLCSVGAMALDSASEVLAREWDLTGLNNTFGLSLDIEKILHSDHIMRAEAVPGEPMLDFLTTAKEDGKSVSISKEARNLLTLLPLYKEFAADTAELPEILTAAVDCIEKSDALTAAADELQTAAREKWMNKEEFLGYNPKKPDGSLGEYLAQVICSSEENLSVRELAEKVLAIIS